jgi:hypothetical protein
MVARFIFVVQVRELARPDFEAWHGWLKGTLLGIVA